MEKDATSVLADLKKGTYAPVYFLEGGEPFFIDQISNFIEKKILDETAKSFNQSVYYGKDVELSTVMGDARQFPMMSDKRVVLVKEAQHLKDLNTEAGAKLLENYLNAPLDSTILVFCYKGKTIDKRKKPGKTIKDKAVLVSTKALYDNQIPDWINQQIKQMGLKAEPQIANVLYEFIGSDLSRIYNELQKLSINLEEGKQITTDLIYKYIGISKEYNVIELQKALADKNAEKVFKIVFHFARNPKNNPIVPVLAVLYGFFARILTTHAMHLRDENAMKQALGINYYQALDLKKAASRYSYQKTANIIHYLREADLKSKGVTGGQVSEADILKELMFKILA